MRLRILFLLLGIICFLLGAGLIAIAGMRFWQQTRQPVKVSVEKAPEVSVTLLEGWTNQQMAEALYKAGVVSSEAEFITAAKQVDVSKYGAQGKFGAEGFLFPDTYRFHPKTDADEVVSRLTGTLLKKVDDNGLNPETRVVIPGFEQLSPRAGQKLSGWSLFDVLTLAAVVERESGRVGGLLPDGTRIDANRERQLIAGVFLNRLKIGMALESDATVNYVTGKADPGAKLADLEVNSPYNTYKYPGLPPSPITNPSLGAILAVLNPEPSSYYFFLHRQSTGEVVFSRNFEEHKRAKLIK